MERTAPASSNGEFKSIRERTREIQAHVLTLNDVTQDVIYTHTWHQALTAKSESVRLKATELCGKAHGMWIERHVGETRTYDVAAMLKIIAGDNPALMARIAEQIPLMPGESVG